MSIKLTKQASVVVGILLGLSLSSCSSISPKDLAENHSNTSSSSTPQKITFRSKVPTDKLVPKYLPILGDDREQLDFKVKDAQAIFDNKPRPTSPITLAVLAGNPPPDIDVCNLPFSALTKDMFEKCAEQGMGYIQTANTFGFAGDLTTEAGNTKTYTWKNGDGMVAITFVDDKLASKTQTNLK